MTMKLVRHRESARAIFCIQDTLIFQMIAIGIARTELEVSRYYSCRTKKIFTEYVSEYIESDVGSGKRSDPRLSSALVASDYQTISSLTQHIAGDSVECSQDLVS